MTPERRSERERRDEAQRLAEGLVQEAVREVPPSGMKQMLSLRVDPQLQPAEDSKRTWHNCQRATHRGCCADCEYVDLPDRRYLPSGPAHGDARHDVSRHCALQGRAG